MDDLTNIFRREAERVLARRALGVRVGTISSYDPKTHAVKLTIQPEGIQTGWMPLATQSTGAGFGIFSGPTLGDSVVVAFHDGEPEAGIVIGRLPTNDETPVPTQSGEYIAQTPWGSFIKLLQDGSVTVQDQGGASIALDGQGNITATGKSGATIVIDSSGNITLTADGGNVVVNNLVVTGGITGKNGGPVPGILKVSGDVVAGVGTGDLVSLQGHSHPANNQPPTPNT
jgi:phage baseplate assembly protein gpV